MSISQLKEILQTSVHMYMLHCGLLFQEKFCSKNLNSNYVFMIDQYRDEMSVYKSYEFDKVF